MLIILYKTEKKDPSELPTSVNQLVKDVLIRSLLESEEEEPEVEGGGKTLEDSNEYVYEEYLDSNEEMQQPPLLDESEDRVGNDLQGPSMLGFRNLVLFLFLVQYLIFISSIELHCYDSSDSCFITKAFRKVPLDRSYLI